MNDSKVYNGPSGKEVGKWKRIWTKPLSATDTHVDPYSPKDFIKATNKEGSVGDLFDRSAELSAKRTEKEGRDPLKEGFFKNYSRTHKGAQHPEQKRQQSTEFLAKHGIKIDWGDN